MTATHLLLVAVLLCGLVFVLPEKGMIRGIATSMPFALIMTGIAAYDLATSQNPAFPWLATFGLSWAVRLELVFCVSTMLMVLPHGLLVGLRYSRQRGR
jgi:hypothetical protein